MKNALSSRHMRIVFAAVTLTVWLKAVCVCVCVRAAETPPVWQMQRLRGRCAVYAAEAATLRWIQRWCSRRGVCAAEAVSAQRVQRMSGRCSVCDADPISARQIRCQIRCPRGRYNVRVAATLSWRLMHNVAAATTSIAVTQNLCGRCGACAADTASLQRMQCLGSVLKAAGLAGRELLARKLA